MALALLLAFAMTGAQAQLSTCRYLEYDGCCGLACQKMICQSLYSSGKLLGAAESGKWMSRTGWDSLYAYNGPADVACQHYQSGTAAAAAMRPSFCSWHGIMCNATAYSSTCSQSRWAYGVSNITITNNNLSGYINNEFAASMKQLHDCGLETLVIGGASFELHGTISPLFGQLTQLRTLGIFGTNVTGVIPPELGNMTSLENLDLNTNYLVGTIPPELGQLSTLQRLNLGYNGWSDRGEALTGTFPAEWLRLKNLQILMLDHNGLYGTLPDSMCHKLTKLSAVSFGNNHLSGPAAHFGNCFSLTALDLSDNNFIGPVPLPNGTAWAQLQNLRLNNNNFTGPLPSFDIGQAPQLSYMLLSNNSLTGTIPVSWTYLPFLTVVEASFNYIRGEVPWQLAFQSRLWVLALDNNPNLTGVIDSRWRFSVGLSSLRLHNTDMKGPLPGISRRQFAGMADQQDLCGSDASGLGRLPLLQDVSIYNTNMTAKCISDPDGTCQDIEDALPWYLNLDYSAWQIPLPEDGFASNDNMQCPTVVQEKYCHQAGPPSFFSNDIRPHWDVSPSYYHYLGCQCQAGFIEHRVQVWHDDVLIPELRCEKALTASQIAGISVSVSAVGLVLLAYLAYISWYGRFGLPKLRRAYADVKKRLVGAPTSGKISVVVTDIESYSAMIVAMPLVMGRAMSLHNNAVRKAAWTHFGFIVGQEGDSYILAFSDALDAVAFCLQFQQALKRIDWPPELLQYLQHQEAAALGLTPAPWTSPVSPHTHGPSRLTANESRWKNFAAVVGEASSGGLVGGDLSRTSGDESHTVAAGPSREGSRFWSAISRPQRSSHSGSAASSRILQSHAPSSDVPNGPPSHLCSPSALPGTDASGTPSQDALPGLEEQRLYQQAPQVATATALIPGFRVRMGIASGVLSDKEHDLLTCRVLEVARVVSDAAVGGQVLMDGNTFRAVKDRLEELGQVGPSGYSRSNRVTGWGTPRGWLAKLVARHSRSLTAEAQVLDMGLYTVPGFKLATERDAAAVLPQLPQLPVDMSAQLQAVSGTGKDPALTAPEQPQQPRSEVTHGWTAAEQSPAADDTLLVSSLQQVPQRTLAAAEAPPRPPVVPSVTLQPVPSAGSAACPCACIRLYQVLAPRLVDRAHLFGNQLSLKDGSRCHDLPYFSAPAAANRPTLDADLQQQPLLANELRRMSNSGSCVVGGVAHTGRKAAFVADATPAATAQQVPITPDLSSVWPGRSQRRQQQQQHASLLASQPSLNSHHKSSGGDGAAPAATLAVGAPGRPVASDEAVTFVFCSVMMPRIKLSMDTNPKLTAQISSIVGKVIRECIMAFARTPIGSSGQQAEGYLCRDLGGDMKYMLAFHNPRVALEWCLLVQEVLLWQAWPASLLDKPRKANEASDHQPQVLGRRASMVIPTTAAAAAAAAHVGPLFWGVGNGVMHASPPVCAQSNRSGSQPLFRGPRLKMGVCSGSPQTVTPDHQGRADYHGNAVNMAARFEAICAQGGQIVCEAALAEAVVAEWTALQQQALAAATASGQATGSIADASIPPVAAGPAALQCLEPVQRDSGGGQPAGSCWSEQQAEVACRVSPFQAASCNAVQRQGPVAVPLSLPAAAPSINSLRAGASFPGPWSPGSSPADAASSSLAAATSIPTAGAALSQLVKDSDAASITDTEVVKASATLLAAVQAAEAAAANQPLPLPIPGRATSHVPAGLVSSAEVSPSALSGRVATASAAAAPLSPPTPAAAHAANGRGGVTMVSSVSGDSSAGLGLSAATAGTSGGLLAGFFATAASSLQAKGGVAPPRRSGRAPRAAARSGALTLAPAPTDLACPSCVPELPPEAFGVEVHQVGKFLVKGHTGPVEIVEVLLSHLSARRQLLGDNITKAQKGCCIQLQTARIAAVDVVHLPGVARLYRQQHAQQLTAAAAAGADLALPFAAQQAALLVPSDGVALTAPQRQLLEQQSMIQRTASMFKSASFGSRRPDSAGIASAQSLSVAGSGDSTQTVSAVQSGRRPSEQQPQRHSTSPLSLLWQGGGHGAVQDAADEPPVSCRPPYSAVAIAADNDGALELPVMRRKLQDGLNAADDAV